MVDVSNASGISIDGNEVQSVSVNGNEVYTLANPVLELNPVRINTRFRPRFELKNTGNVKAKAEVYFYNTDHYAFDGKDYMFLVGDDEGQEQFLLGPGESVNVTHYQMSFQENEQKSIYTEYTSDSPNTGENDSFTGQFRT